MAVWWLLQCVAVCCSMLQLGAEAHGAVEALGPGVCCSVVQCVAGCCNILQRVANGSCGA